MPGTRFRLSVTRSGPLWRYARLWIGRFAPTCNFLHSFSDGNDSAIQVLTSAYTWDLVCRYFPILRNALGITWRYRYTSVLFLLNTGVLSQVYFEYLYISIILYLCILIYEYSNIPICIYSNGCMGHRGVGRYYIYPLPKNRPKWGVTHSASDANAGEQSSSHHDATTQEKLASINTLERINCMYTLWRINHINTLWLVGHTSGFSCTMSK